MVLTSTLAWALSSSRRRTTGLMYLSSQALAAASATVSGVAAARAEAQPALRMMHSRRSLRALRGWGGLRGWADAGTAAASASSAPQARAIVLIGGLLSPEDWAAISRASRP